MSNSTWHKGSGRKNGKRGRKREEIRKEGAPVRSDETVDDQPSTDEGPEGEVLDEDSDWDEAWENQDDPDPYGVSPSAPVVDAEGTDFEVPGEHGVQQWIDSMSENSQEDRDDALLGALAAEELEAESPSVETPQELDAAVVRWRMTPAVSDEAIDGGYTRTYEGGVSAEEIEAETVQRDHTDEPVQNEEPQDHTDEPVQNEEPQDHTDEPVQNEEPQDHTDEPVQNEEPQDHTDEPVQNEEPQDRRGRGRRSKKPLQVQQMLFDPSELAGGRKEKAKDPYRPRLSLAPTGIKTVAGLSYLGAALALAVLAAEMLGILPASLPDLPSMAGVELPGIARYVLASLSAVLAIAAGIAAGRGNAPAYASSTAAAVIVSLAGNIAAAPVLIPAVLLSRTRTAREWLI